MTDDIVNSVLDRLEEIGIYVDAELLDTELSDPKDLIFYEVVMESRKNEESYLIIGNLKHFPREYYIVSPREMLDILEEGWKKFEM